MCGFAMFFKDKLISEKDIKNLKKMTLMQEHRGPDSEGFFTDKNIILGFRRLSIIDSEKGSQPLSYDNDRYTVVFNGEIYNYIELRNMLINKGYIFNTDSDTEVIPALYSYMGSKMVDYLRGMFAFVVWDRKENTIFAGRDPLGIKPFYYMEDMDGLYCASEKKSLMVVIRKPPEIDMESMHHYLTFQYVPEPRVLEKNIRILEPGHTIFKRLNEDIKINKYFRIQFNKSNDSTERKLSKIRYALEDSVAKHMRSDVPVASLLSGGIDSTIILALVKRINPKIKTFTVGFENEGYSEISYAKETAQELGIENINKVITHEEFINELPKIIWHMDAPLADPAAIPLYFVAREAAKHVKVVLSGEGADELFGGYNIYREPESLKIFTHIPDTVKRLLNGVSHIIPDGVKGKSFISRGCTHIEERYVGNANIFNQLEKELYIRNYNREYAPGLITRPLFQDVTDYDDVTKMQYIDIHTWLRGDILLKADRMTMAHSLELRVPFLDRKVIDIALQLGYDDKIGNNTTKYALREAFSDLIPSKVFKRRKLGFPVPIRHWLKDEIYEWARGIIMESHTDMFIRKNSILDMLERHRTGSIDYSRRIWTLIIFMIWHQVFVEGKYSFNRDMDAYMEDEIRIS